ncbi:hypothetical protein GCM10007964_18370 [Sphaerisporangium melleum]|uniref:Uncharacterized protein n=2 Tax=Sphaerisporangium melleum TaxID=321316 RepID=A0A917QZ01_9ACTN|nr:hypothetical protein GCM10007964_18370 [Sphaerisporangium melleum]
MARMNRSNAVKCALFAGVGGMVVYVETGGLVVRRFPWPARTHRLWGHDLQRVNYGFSCPAGDGAKEIHRRKTFVATISVQRGIMAFGDPQGISGFWWDFPSPRGAETGGPGGGEEKA